MKTFTFWYFAVLHKLTTYFFFQFFAISLNTKSVMFCFSKETLNSEFIISWI